MALNKLFCQFFKINFNQISQRSLSNSAVINSMYEKHFVPPITDINKIKNLEKTKELDIEKLKSFQATPSNITFSIFDDELVRKLENMSLKKRRNKDSTQQVIADTFRHIKQIQLKKYHRATADEKPNIELNASKIFRKAVENSRPLLVVKRVKKAGSMYLVPGPITEKKSYFQALKWLLEAGRERPKSRTFIYIPSFGSRLAAEILDAYNNTGKTISKKIERHRIAEANRAYSNYRPGI